MLNALFIGLRNPYDQGMKRKALKISWRAWCLQKLAIRDYSVFEMKQKIVQRANDSEQEVDPEPVIQGLVEEGLLDDLRYLQNQLSMAYAGNPIKGPREIRRKLETKGGLSSHFIDQYLQDDDTRWFELAEKTVKQTLAGKGFDTTATAEIPGNILQQLKQKLYRKGFTKTQIDHATHHLKPVFHVRPAAPVSDIQNEIEKGMRSGKGPLAIKQQLKQKGVPEASIDEHIDIKDPIWMEKALEQLQHKYRNVSLPPRTFKEKHKMSDFLARRGFLSSQIRAALEQLLSQ